MSKKKTEPIAEKSLVIANPNDLKPRLKELGGSQSDEWNLVLANQALGCVWFSRSNEDYQQEQRNSIGAALVGIAPRDEMEGMVAAQLIAAHNAAMECYRRAMIPEQTFEGRRENLNQANKLSRTYGALLETLNRHRGKGQQKVTVEHVHVHAGGQAVVGLVENTGGGDRKKSEKQPHAKPNADAPESEMRSENTNGDAMSGSRND